MLSDGAWNFTGVAISETPMMVPAQTAVSIGKAMRAVLLTSFTSRSHLLRYYLGPGFGLHAG